MKRKEELPKSDYSQLENECWKDGEWEESKHKKQLLRLLQQSAFTTIGWYCQLVEKESVRQRQHTHQMIVMLTEMQRRSDAKCQEEKAQKKRLQGIKVKSKRTQEKEESITYKKAIKSKGLLKKTPFGFSSFYYT